MSSFFGLFNFSKPGPGVPKDAPKKRGFFIFFEVLMRKFWKICQLSLQYALCSIPYLIVYFGLGVVISFIYAGSTTNNLQEILLYAASLALFFSAFLGGGSASAGQARVLRDYSRETHSFIWSDFFEGVTGNFGKCFVAFLLNILVTFLAFFNVHFCIFEPQNLLPPIISLTTGFFSIVLFIIWTIVQQYVYNIMVTLDVGLGTCYKYAFALAFAKLPVNLILIIVSSAVFWAFIYLTLTKGIFFLLFFPCLLFSLCSFIPTFYATSVIDNIIFSEEEN